MKYSCLQPRQACSARLWSRSLHARRVMPMVHALWAYNTEHTGFVRGLQTANRETGANCKNVSLHRGKAVIKQRFQTGSVDEVCFLGTCKACHARIPYWALNQCSSQLKCFMSHFLPAQNHCWKRCSQTDSHSMSLRSSQLQHLPHALPHALPAAKSTS